MSQAGNYVLSQAGNLVGTLGPLVDPSRPQKQHRRDRSFLKEKKSISHNVLTLTRSQQMLMAEPVLYEMIVVRLLPLLIYL